MDNGVGILRALPSGARGLSANRRITRIGVIGFRLNTSFPFYSMDIETVQPGEF